MAAIDDLPEDTSYLDVLRTSATETEHEARWRLLSLKGNKRPNPRAGLESALGVLFEQHGGTVSTYDPRRYVEPRGGQGARGGRMAQLLQAAYAMAGVDVPADLLPALQRLKSESKVRARAGGGSTDLAGGFPRADGSIASYSVDGRQPKLSKPTKRR